MTTFRLPNDLENREARVLVRILRERASTFLNWGYDETSFWIELDAQARNPWPDLLRDLFRRVEAVSTVPPSLNPGADKAIK